MMLLNKEKPVVSVSSLIHSTNNHHHHQRNHSWQGPLWTDHIQSTHAGVGVVPGLGMSGGGGGIGRQSPPLTPLEGMAPNTIGDTICATLNSNIGPPSPGFTIGSPSSSSGNFASNSNLPSSASFPPSNHPLSGSKHLCAICEDRASGKHYGVYSCEGCKGFFKRTVRKELQYSCRESKGCIIDKRHRNRCQFCRYNKCLTMGMKREAVQEERQRSKSNIEKESSVSGAINLEMSIVSIKEAEAVADPDEDNKPIIKEEELRSALVVAVRKQLEMLITWAKLVPHFRDLPLNDQLLLLKNGWNELLISALSHRSVYCTEGVMLANGVIVDRGSAQHIGVGPIFDRVLTELVAKMRDMKIDKEELGCLRTIVLFNPDVKGLSCSSHVENLRERVYTVLEDYTRSKDVGRFPKLLLRLPALRSIGLRCIDHLFYANKDQNNELPTIDTYIMNKLQEENIMAH